MLELEQDDPIPQGDLALQITALPRETNGFGDIYGGWLVSQMDLAGTAMASKIAGGRVATVAIDRMAFLVPVAVGAQLSFYTQALDDARSVLLANFNADNPQSKAMLDSLNALADQPVSVVTPDLSESLAAVQAYIQRRHLPAEAEGGKP